MAISDPEKSPEQSNSKIRDKKISISSKETNNKTPVNNKERLYR